MRKKILIFYISRYSGHFHAASAIEKGLLEIIGEKTEIEKINALAYTNPILEKIINRAYLEVIKKKPELWGHIYDNPDVIKNTKKAREALHRFNMSKMKKLIEAKAPDAIYCTQAFPCGMVADYKRTRGKDLPLVGVLTDYAPHSYWLFDEVNFYVAPSAETARVLVDRGIPSPKVKAYGIPVDPKFRDEHDLGPLRKSLGFREEDPTILIMGGSQGLGAVEEAVRSLLLDTEHNYQLLVVAGSNKKLYTRLKRLKRRNKGNNIQILSYADNISELMELSDIIVTKAGGMTTAEAMVKKLPVLIVKPIPGHERMNADFLVKKGAAVEIAEHGQIHRKINELFDSEDALDRMKESAGKLSHPDSALDTAKLVS